MTTRAARLKRTKPASIVQHTCRRSAERVSANDLVGQPLCLPDWLPGARAAHKSCWRRLKMQSVS